ncbi:MAG TPA: class I SAM-dependent methyltransferase [Candidatus Angelobacter sp.]|nr:class I SAM-dependent methyltransferase [Candidatus Angelobacter sp.]
MSRLHLFEFEDQSWFPSLIRGFMTDYLHFTASLNPGAFEPFSSKVKEVLQQTGETTLIDLCSGGGGPIPQVAKMLAEKEHYDVTVCLTDLFPNLEAFQRIEASIPEVKYISTPVDATAVPSELRGVRTVFNAFHHFEADQARKILSDAVKANQGIVILELLSRSFSAGFSVVLAVLLMFFLTPFIRPFRVSRLFFTYLVPLVPLFTLWDGLISCFRVYSLAELNELTSSIPVQDYRWAMGQLPLKGGPGFVTYLIGQPMQTANQQASK